MPPSMTAGNVVGLASAICGVAGTCFLYMGSFALIQPPGFLGSPEATRKVVAKNKQLRRLQRIGLGFLLIGFILQAVAVFA